MGAILLIEDDRNVHGLIEKIFPKEDLRILRSYPFEKESNLGSQESQNLQGVPPLVLEQAFRKYLKEEIDTGHEGNIHESIIGKVEKALIGIVLEAEKGNQVRAAKRLGINRNTLRKKMKELQIITRVVTG